MRSCRNTNFEVEIHYPSHVVPHMVRADAYIRHTKEVSVLNTVSSPTQQSERSANHDEIVAV